MKENMDKNKKKILNTKILLEMRIKLENIYESKKEIGSMSRMGV